MACSTPSCLFISASPSTLAFAPVNKRAAIGFILQVMRATNIIFFVKSQAEGQDRCLAVRAASKEVGDQLQALLNRLSTQAKLAAAGNNNAGSSAAGAAGSSGPGALANHFDAKTDKGSSDLYFHYYGMIMHQQNMLQVCVDFINNLVYSYLDV